MPTRYDQIRQAAVRAAMTKVLTAEREIEQSVHECRQRAAQTLESARKQARQIRRRTERRITSLHERCAQVTQAHVETLQQVIGSDAHCEVIEDHDSHCVDLAVRRVAALLISADEDGD